MVYIQVYMIVPVWCSFPPQQNATCGFTIIIIEGAVWVERHEPGNRMSMNKILNSVQCTHSVLYCTSK